MFFHAVRRPPSSIICVRRAFFAKSVLRAAASDNATSRPPSELTAKSSCFPNTIIEGVNYLKGQEPVVALPDEDYPDWLWTILEPKQWVDDGPGGKAERVARKLERQKRIKDRNFMKTQ